jgi:hypothetical protein
MTPSERLAPYGPRAMQLVWLIESYMDKHPVIDPIELAADVLDAAYLLATDGPQNA